MRIILGSLIRRKGERAQLSNVFHTPICRLAPRSPARRPLRSRHMGRAFDLWVPQEKLNSAEIAGSANIRFALVRRSEWVPKTWDPVQFSRSTPRSVSISAWISTHRRGGRRIRNRLASSVDFVCRRHRASVRSSRPHGLPGLSLTHRCAVEGDTIRSDILDFEGDNIASAQLAIDRKVEHRQIAYSVFNSELAVSSRHVRANGGFAPINLPLFHGTRAEMLGVAAA